MEHQAGSWQDRAAEEPAIGADGIDRHGGAEIEHDEVPAKPGVRPDCDADLNVPVDTEKGEILSCPGCGLELEVKQINGGCVDLQELTIEGEDWGE